MAVAGGISQITLNNFTFIGSPDFLPKQQVPQQYQWVDTLSKTVSRHSLKVGVELRAPMRNIYHDEPGTRGSLERTKRTNNFHSEEMLLFEVICCRQWALQDPVSKLAAGS